MRRAEARKIFERFGRDGISDRAMQLAKEIIESDARKRTAVAIGQFKELWLLCQADDYWSEKTGMGEAYEKENIGWSLRNNKPLIENPTPVRWDGNIDWEVAEKRKSLEMQNTTRSKEAHDRD